MIMDSQIETIIYFPLYLITMLYAINARSDLVETPRQNKDEDTLFKQKKELIGIWKRKKEQEMQKKDESMLVKTTLHAQNKENQWYIYSGCSSHMTGDKSKFLTLKEVNGGSVTFGSDVTARIARKGTLSLNNGKTKT
jgi:hydroxymethylpyrimidine/phosphomethylpyrimidine kinase